MFLDLVGDSGNGRARAVPLFRRRRTTAVPVSTRNASARARNVDQPIAASVPLLSGTPLAVNATAASAAMIAIERWVLRWVIWLSLLGLRGRDVGCGKVAARAHAARVTISLGALVARAGTISFASARRSSETLMARIQTNVSRNVGGSADVKLGMLASSPTAMAIAK